MSKPRTPTSILDAKGAYQKNPARRRQGEPKPKRPLGAAPKHFDEEHQAIWAEFKKLLPPGVAFNCDRWACELLCKLMCKERHGTIMVNERTQLISLFSRFGLSPSDRSKVSVEKPPEDKLAAFLHKRA